MKMTMKTLLLGGLAALALSACGGADTAIDKAADNAGAALKDASAATSEAKMKMMAEKNAASLDLVLAAQSDENKARFQYRNPKETLEFFGIEPGMSVVEVLPGGGWYTKILLPYLGDEGRLVGVDYPVAMWPEFGGFADADFIEKKKTWPQDWSAKAEAWRAGAQTDIQAYAFDNVDSSLNGTVDAVLFIRALHNLSRFEEKGGYLTTALGTVNDLLKPGGIVGVVQHQAPESNSDETSKGERGYLKKSGIIAKMESAGFEFVGESDINANPKDVTGNEDIVWRLLPSLRGHDDKPEQKAKFEAIGESNRMTLLFKKP